MLGRSTTVHTLVCRVRNIMAEEQSRCLGIISMEWAIECGGFSYQAQNRAKYYQDFARKFNFKIRGEELFCDEMDQFSSRGSAGSFALYWAPESGCKLVTWQTAYNSLVEGDYDKCKGLPSSCGSNRSSNPVQASTSIPRQNLCKHSSISCSSKPYSLNVRSSTPSLRADNPTTINPRFWGDWIKRPIPQIEETDVWF